MRLVSVTVRGTDEYGNPTTEVFDAVPVYNMAERAWHFIRWHLWRRWRVKRITRIVVMDDAQPE